MNPWPELEFVLQEEETVAPPVEDLARRSQRIDCTGWEDVVFEIADDAALD
jgi:hypothetical protein